MAKLDKLITYAYFREECDMPQNLPDGELEHKIYRAQEMLRMLMGEDFYIDFLTAYKAGSLSAAYQALYDPYLKQFIAWQAHEFWAIKANIKINRSGFRVHSEDNSVAATDTQMATINKDAGYQSQYYKGLMLGFLKKNIADYPLYAAHCGCSNKAGNSFHISAVKNKHKEPEPYGTRRGCKSW
jgi:hypothetical protein